MVDFWYVAKRIPQPQTIHPCAFCQHFSSIQPKHIQYSLCLRTNINKLLNQPINLWYCQISWQLYLTTKNNLVWALATTGLAGSIVEQFYLC